MMNIDQDLVERPVQPNECLKFHSFSAKQSDPLAPRASYLDQASSASSICPAPISRQFWKAGNYYDGLTSKKVSLNVGSYLRIHPKFLHSNATSHKWVFGAVAELLDNVVDEVQNGATFVVVDKISNSRDGSSALLIQDDGGGMDPDTMRRCLSFGFSDKKSETAIGQYGNGFKTSTMRLGSDVLVFSCCSLNRKCTRSVGLLSYTFLMQMQQDRIVVPMVHYQFNSQSNTWEALLSEEQLKANLSILFQWSPFSSEDQLVKQFDDMGAHGSKIIVYDLWHNEEGVEELDFESDPEDICLSGKGNSAAKVGSRTEAMEQHLANRIHYSLRAYLSVIYLKIPDNFCIVLRGRVVEYHSIASDLKYPEFVVYKPHNMKGSASVITTIGFLKEAPIVNIGGFNVYHKNRLILPFWRVASHSDGRCRGVVGKSKLCFSIWLLHQLSDKCGVLHCLIGILEANFIEPTHNKQDFEKTPVFQKLETRLRDMAREYWDTHCRLIGYDVAHRVPRYNVTKEAQPTVLPESASESRQGHGTSHVAKKPRQTVMIEAVASDSGQGRGIYQPVVLNALPNNAAAKSVGTEQHADRTNRLGEQEKSEIIQENKKLRAQFEEYKNMEEELNRKRERLREEIKEARYKYAQLLLDSKLLEKHKQEKP